MDSTEKHFAEHLEVTFVPDVIRRRYMSDPTGSGESTTNNSHATLLWIDIFNFSPLCNRLMADTHRGVEKITGILKSHYDFLLEMILAYGGEPLFFVGDGLMSAWFSDEGEAHNAIRSAAACAQHILRDRYTKDDNDKKLSLHAVISFGPWDLVELESVQQSKLMSFYGKVFHELTRASINRAPDEVLITNKALIKLPESPGTRAVENDTHVLMDVLTISQPHAKEPVQVNDTTRKHLIKFAPLTIKFPISRQRLSWISEIRPVTSIFVQLPNRSVLKNDNVNHLQHLGTIAGPLVEKYDGLLNQIWMDDKESNIFICFGPAPSAHIDNASRAVKLAMELHESLKKEGYTNGVGVCTGMAYCGILGNDILRQYTVIGDVVNLSARLAGVASDTVFCDNETVRQSKQAVVFDFVDERPIKGRSEPIEVYNPVSILAEDAAKSNIQAMVGRQAELENLLDAYHNAAAGHGSICFLEGDSGMGKSRLIDVLEKQIPTGDRRFLRASGDHIMSHTPYRVLTPVFMSLLELDHLVKSEGSVLDVDQLPNRYRDQAALLNIVLSTNFMDTPTTKQLAGAQRAEATFKLLLEIVQNESEKHPLVIAVDDAHWMDASSWKLVQAIGESIANIFIILSQDEDDETEVVGKLKQSGSQTIRLGALSRPDQQKLIEVTLGVDEVSDKVVEIIEQTAKGNPFFCIELTTSLRDQNYLVIDKNLCKLNEEVEISASSMPETVRGALRSKIDRLHPGSRLTLKVGSVAGIRFAGKLVHSIYPIHDEKEVVPDYLHRAERTGIINGTPVDDEEGYQFANTTAAEVAYEMTLAEQRRQLHKETALWYEEHFKANLVPFYVRLAHHWREAGEELKAVQYKELEAIRLFRLGFVMQALEVGLQGVEILGLRLERTPETIGPKLQEHMGMIQQFMADRDINSLENHKNLENAVTDKLIQLLLELTPFAHQGHQAELFALLAVTSVRLTLEEGNGSAAAEVYAMYAIIYKAFTGDSQGAYAWSKLALSIDEHKGHTKLARVGFIHCWFIAHWLDPIRSLIDLSQKSSMAGFESGDVVYGCFSLSLEVILKAVGGFKLQEVVDTAERHFQLNNDLVINASFHLKHERQVARAFQGFTTSYTSLTDDRFNEEKDIASICLTDLVNQIGYYFISKIKLAAHYANWQEALEWVDKTQPLLPGFANQPGHAEFEFYKTIAQLYALPGAESNQREALQAAAEQGLQMLDAWASLCPENYGHKAILARGIQKGLGGNTQEASGLFTESINMAKKHAFIQDVGLAYEHQARICIRNGEDPGDLINHAIKAYTAWGANAKSQYLQDKFPGPAK